MIMNSFLQKLSHTDILIKYLTNNNLRKTLEIRNVEVYKKINEVKQILDALVVAERKRIQAKQIEARHVEIIDTMKSDDPVVEDDENGCVVYTTKNNFTPISSLVFESPLASMKDIPLDSGLPIAKILSVMDEGEAKDMWIKEFPEAIVGWTSFILALQKYMNENISTAEERLLKHVLDNSLSNCISAFKFGEFVQSFGPIESCIKNLREVLAMKWFQGHLTSREAELLLKFEPEGTFLVRFSKTRGGSFALAFKLNDGISHILIKSDKPCGFQIVERATTKKVCNIK